MMNNFILSNKSMSRLENVHNDLRSVVLLAIEKTEVDFSVLEGLRTLERQRQLVRDSKSRTMDSRHLTGHAVDLGAWVDGGISWDWEHYIAISVAMKESAEKLNVSIVWGGDWDTFKDGVHFQLSRVSYPIFKDA